MSTNQKSGSVLVDFLGSKKDHSIIGKLLLTTVKIQFEKKDEANKQLLLLRDEHTRGGDTADSSVSQLPGLGKHSSNYSPSPGHDASCD